MNGINGKKTQEVKVKKQNGKKGTKEKEKKL